MANLQDYKNLKPLARGALFKQVKEESKISYQEISRKIEKSPSYVVNSVRLLELPMAIKDGLMGELVSEGHARALLAVKDQRDCIDIYKRVLKERASVRQVEEFVRQKVKNIARELSQKQVGKLEEYIEKAFGQKPKKITIKRKRHGLEVSILLG